MQPFSIDSVWPAGKKIFRAWFASSLPTVADEQIAGFLPGLPILPIPELFFRDSCREAETQWGFRGFFYTWR